MNIIYSPEYSGENHLPLTIQQPCLLNTLYVDTTGLLAQLELRLGLSTPMLSDVERTAHYLLSLRKHKEGAFYQTAAAHDEMGTAHKLLQWRDNLLMAGWTPAHTGISQKLDDLAALEADFHCMGLPDRWLAIKEFAEKTDSQLHDFQLKDIQLTLDCPMDSLPPLIATTLEALRTHGLTLQQAPEPKATAPVRSNLNKLQAHLLGAADIQIDAQDDTLKVFTAPNQNDVYEWFSTTQLSEGSKVLDLFYLYTDYNNRRLCKEFSFSRFYHITNYIN